MFKKTGRSLKSRSGFMLVGFVLYAPLILLTAFFAVDFLLYYRVAAVIQTAAEEAAKAARSTSIISSANGGGDYVDYVVWQQGSRTDLGEIFTGVKSCLGDDLSNTAGDCFSGWYNLQSDSVKWNGNNPVSAVVWNGYGSTQHRGGAPKPPFTRELPFNLYEPSSQIPGLNRVQYLPTVCSIGSLGGYSKSLPSYVKIDNISKERVQPICWQNEHKADFDGDGIEDIVFFRANKADIDSQNATSADNDWLVLTSTMGFSLSKSLQFNLGGSRIPSGSLRFLRDLPIVEDYDGDGISDFAVFSPAKKMYEIAFSKCGYQVIGRGEVAIGNAQQRGLLAVPGRYWGEGRQTVLGKIALIATGGGAFNATDTGRYSIRVIAPFKGGNVPQDLCDETNHFFPDRSFYSLTATQVVREVKMNDYNTPHPGTFSVPAFADIDGDGLTEMGYMSASAGNETWKVAGADDTGGNVYTDITAMTGGPIQQVRLNPFDLESAPSGSVYMTDAVDGRVFKLKSSARELVGDRGETLELVVNELTPSRSTLTGTPQQNFPVFNVWNARINPFASYTGELNAAEKEAPDALAKERRLFYPKRMVLGPDKALYVADMFGRIIRVYNGQEPSGDTPSKVVLGSIKCGRTPLDPECKPLGLTPVAQNQNRYQGSNFFKVQFQPIALAVVPDAATTKSAPKYHLAVSSGRSVYIIKASDAVSNANGWGPSGIKNEVVQRIAGDSSKDPNWENAKVWFNAGNSALSSSFCPISDLAFDYYKYNQIDKASLVAASSCSLFMDQYQTHLSLSGGTSVGYQNQVWAGGILRIFSDTDNFFTPNLTVSRVAGNFMPAIDDLRDIGQVSDVTGAAVQRKVDISPSLGNKNDIDIINPSAVEVDPAGNIYFINQANFADGGILDPTGNRVIDRHYIKNLFRLVVDANDTVLHVEPLNNPLAYNTFPVESSYWYSPSPHAISLNNSPKLWAAPWRAPAKLINFPSTAAITFDYNFHSLYTSTPYLPNDISGGNEDNYDPETAYHVNPKQVGFVYKMNLDSDGMLPPSGYYDFAVALTPGNWTEKGELLANLDADGDGVPNSAELNSEWRSPFCPEINRLSKQRCRLQDKLGLPQLYSFNIKINTLGRLISLYNDAGDQVDYLEYILFRSSSEYKDGIYKSRPQVWAELLNLGDQRSGVIDDLVLGEDKERLIVGGRRRLNANGPIARLQRATAFVDKSGDSSVPKGDYPGKYDFKFPFIFASMTPYEAGMGATRLNSKGAVIRVYTSYAPGIFDSGIICGRKKQPSFDPPLSPSAAWKTDSAFRLSYNSYLNFYFYSADKSGYIGKVNDSLIFTDPYSVTPSPCGSSPRRGIDGILRAYEGIILQLDHDDYKKDLQYTSPPKGPNWPLPWMTGREPEVGKIIESSAPENTRVFYMIDLDGRGRKPAWLAREVYFDPGRISSPDDFRQRLYRMDARKINRLFVLAAGALDEQSSLFKNISYQHYPLSPRSLAGDVGLPFSYQNQQSSVEYPPFFQYNAPDASSPVASTLFDEDKDTTDGLIVSLEYEPFFPNSVLPLSKYYSATPSEKYLLNNRFYEFGNQGSGIVERAIKVTAEKGLKVVRVGTSLDPKPYELSIRFGQDEGTGVDTGEPACILENNCNLIKVSYGYKVLGINRVVAKQVSYITDSQNKTSKAPTIP